MHPIKLGKQVKRFFHLLKQFLYQFHAFLTGLCIGAGRRLFAWVPVLWGGGTLLYFAPTYEPGRRIACAAAVLGFVILSMGWRQIVLRSCGAVMLLVAGGFLSVWFESHAQPPMPYLPRHAVIVSGRVCGLSLFPPRHAGQRGTRRIKLCDSLFHDWLNNGMHPLKRYLLIRLKPEDETPLGYGQHVSVRALLHLPAWPVYPGARDMQREAWFSGEAGRGYALGAVDARGNEHAHSLQDLRQRVARAIGRHLHGQDAAIAQTVLAGETGGLSAETRALYAASGLAHLLAVAGLHLGLVMAFVLFLVRNGLALWARAALCWPCRQIAFALALTFGAFYVCLTGAHLPAIRSLGMACLVVVGILTGRQALSLRSLALVAMAILVARPSVILDISFQMSFAAVLALISGYEVLRPVLVKAHAVKNAFGKVRAHFIMLFATSFFAGLATLPLVAAHFNVVQPWFVLANLVAVPIAGAVVMPMGVLALIAMPFHLEGGFLQVMGLGIEMITGVANLVNALPYAHIAVPRAPWWGLILYGLCLSGLCLTRRWWRVMPCVGILIALFSPYSVTTPDLLVSSDGGLLGIQENGILYLTKPEYLQKWSAAQWISDFDRSSRRFSAILNRSENQCEEGVCRISVQGKTVLLNTRAVASLSAMQRQNWCAQAAVIINIPPARALCPGALEINRSTAWREGAYAIKLRRARPKILTDRTYRGARLWSPQFGNIGAPNMPLAPSE